MRFLLPVFIASLMLYGLEAGDADCGRFFGDADCGRSIPGGFSEVDTRSEIIQKLADKALSKYNIDKVEDYFRLKVEVVKAERQYVGGTNYRLKVLTGLTACRTKPPITYIGCRLGKERKVINFQIHTDFKGNIESIDYSFEPEGCMPGGFCPIDRESAKVKELAYKAIEAYNKDRNEDHKRVLVKVLGADFRIASNYMGYRLNVLTGITACPNPWNKNGRPWMPCVETNEYERKTIVFIVGTDFKGDVQSISYHKDKVCRPDGFCVRDPTSQEIPKLASLALAKFNDQFFDARLFVLDKVVKAEEQRGEDSRYKLVVIASPTNCRKLESTRPVCTPKVNGQVAIVFEFRTGFGGTSKLEDFSFSVIPYHA